LLSAEKGGDSVRKLIVSLFASATLFAGLAGPAAAQQQDGLVNIIIGDVTILEDVRLAVAANIVAGVCVQDVNVLAVDLGQTGAVTCEVRGNRPSITITQN
jgi:hypothetical protein